MHVTNIINASPATGKNSQITMTLHTLYSLVRKALPKMLSSF